MAALTSDNLLLPRPKNPENPADGTFAVDCKTGPERIADLVRESLAPTTRAAYLSDLAHFENWGGRIPAETETVAAYLAAHADILSLATLNRRLAALAKIHRSHGLANPTSSELVKSVLRGLKRVKGMAQRQVKPLLKEETEGKLLAHTLVHPVRHGARVFLPEKDVNQLSFQAD